MDYRLLGAAAALLSSAAWALGPVLFRKAGDSVSPLGLNLAKGIIGTVYLGILLLIFGFNPIAPRDVALLALSGILGIAFGDTFFFMGLMRLGPRMAVLIETLCPVAAVLMAVALLGERPSHMVWAGIILTTGGVSWVLWERAPREELKEKWASGIKFGILSVLATASGIIITKIAVERVQPVEATAIRLVFGTIGLLAWGSAGFRFKNWLSPIKKPGVAMLLAVAVFVSVCLGLLFSVMALKYTDAAIAVPLNSTSPLFVLPMAALVFHEKISPRSFFGALMSVLGIILIFLNT